MKVQQRDIVELNYELPNGRYKIHPALIISNENFLNTEDIFYAVMISSNPINDEFTIRIFENQIEFFSPGGMSKPVEQLKAKVFPNTGLNF